MRKLMAGALAPMLLVPGGGAAAAGDGGVQALDAETLDAGARIRAD